MDELAAMATYSPAEFAYSGTSGIMLTSESSGTLVPNGSLDFTSGLTATQVNLEGNKGIIFVLKSIFYLELWEMFAFSELFCSFKCNV